MNPFDIEQKRIDVINSLPTMFGRARFFTILEFYSLLLDSKSKTLINAYLDEFLDELLIDDSDVKFLFLPLEQLEIVEKLLKQIEEHINTNSNREKLNLLLQRIDFQKEQLKKILSGETIECSKKNSFPMLYNTNNSTGEIETIIIKISKAKQADSFLIAPSQPNLDPVLEKQLKVSFGYALNYIKQIYTKTHKFHEVAIFFENKNAHYIGNSLGLALVIGFIEELTKFYNLPYIINIKNNVTLTGGLNDKGEVLPVSEDIIRDKTHLVFYSPYEHFIIPKQDELKALAVLSELKNKFPGRKLQITSVNDINDLLDRRKIVEIKKQSVFVRATKTIKKNWIASILLLILTLILIFIFVKDWDDNPAIADISGDHIFIKNKIGKVLWRKHVASWVVNYESVKKAVLINDINDDGKNEVIFTSELFETNKDFSENYRVACFDNYGQLIWRSFFHDKVTSKREDLSVYYSYSYFIGVEKINKQKRIYLSTRHTNSFASAIYCLDAKTGNRIGSSLWNSGYIGDGLIYDLDKDLKQELIFTFANNGLKRTGVAVISIDKVDGQSPTSDEYTLFNKKNANFKAYILVPNTDYNKYVKAFQNGFQANSLKVRENEQMIYFNSIEGLGEDILCLTYVLSFDLKTIDVFAQSDFTAYRDALVRKGELNTPYTDTKDYYKLIRYQVLYWNGKEFVKRNEFK